MSENSTQEKILDAASRLFLSYGYKRTTVDEIASEAGIAKGSVYLHFDSKESIFGAASLRVCRRVLDAMAAEARSDAPAAERLERVMLTAVLEIWDFCHQAPHAPALWVDVMAAASRYALEAREEGVRIIAEVIADGQATGAFSREWSATGAARLIQLAGESFEPPYLYIDNRREVETQLPRMIQLICRGLNADAPRGQ